jgi:hypothetical protein
MEDEQLLWDLFDGTGDASQVKEKAVNENENSNVLDFSSKSNSAKKQ